MTLVSSHSLDIGVPTIPPGLQAQAQDEHSSVWQGTENLGHRIKTQTKLGEEGSLSEIPLLRQRNSQA